MSFLCCLFVLGLAQKSMHQFHSTLLASLFSVLFLGVHSFALGWITVKVSFYFFFHNVDFGLILVLFCRVSPEFGPFVNFVFHGLKCPYCISFASPFFDTRQNKLFYNKLGRGMYLGSYLVSCLSSP